MAFVCTNNFFSVPSFVIRNPNKPLVFVLRKKGLNGILAAVNYAFCRLFQFEMVRHTIKPHTHTHTQSSTNYAKEQRHEVERPRLFFLRDSTLCVSRTRLWVARGRSWSPLERRRDYCIS